MLIYAGKYFKLLNNIFHKYVINFVPFFSGVTCAAEFSEFKDIILLLEQLHILNFLRQFCVFCPREVLDNLRLAHCLNPGHNWIW